MAILTTTAQKGINFGVFPAVQNVTQKTFVIDANPTSLAAGFFIHLAFLDASAEDWYLGIQITTQRFFFLTTRTTTTGLWTYPTLSTSAFTRIILSYDYSSNANDPVVSYNGSTQTISTEQTPVGSRFSGTNNNLIVGGSSFGNAINGLTINMLIYNRLFSATEHTEYGASRLAIPNRNGLVFAPHLSGAASLTTFDGSTLAAGNTIADTVSGKLGVPAGSPVGRSDQFLTYEG